MAFKRASIHRLFSFCPVLVNAFIVGSAAAWSAPFLKHSQNPMYEITTTSDERSWIASVSELGTLVGFGLYAVVADKLGRRQMLVYISLAFLVKWTIIRFTKSVTMIYVSRIIFGVLRGLGYCTTIAVIGENGSPGQRGVFSSLNLMMYFVGAVVEYVMATYLPYNQVATVNLAFGFLYLASIFMMVEPVQFLISKGRYEEARLNHQRLFANQGNEFEILKQELTKTRAESGLSVTEFFATPAFYKSTALVTSLVGLIYATGYWTVQAYTSIVFASSSFMDANEFTICHGFIMFISCFASSLFIDRFRRRTVLLTALAASALTNLTSATLYYIHESYAPIKHFPWLIFVTVELFAVIATLGLQPINTVLRSEMYPQRIKPLGLALSGSVASLSVFLPSFAFLKIARTFGIFANFLYFAGMCCVTFAVVYLFMPETKGKSLLKIQRMFEKPNAADDTEDAAYCASQVQPPMVEVNREKTPLY